MKKLLLTLSLVAAVTLAYGQGTVQFSNGTLYRISTQEVGSAAVAQVPTTAGLFNYGLFYGTASDNLTLLPTLGVNSTSATGIIASAVDGKTAMNIVPIPDSTAGGSVWIQIRAWSASFGNNWQNARTAFNAGQPSVGYGENAVQFVGPLGPTSGPGYAMWEGAAGTNPARVNAFTIQVNPVPEPTSFALLGLGAAAMLIFRRRS